MLKKHRDIVLIALIFVTTFTLITLSIKNNKSIAYFQSLVISVASPIQSVFTSIGHKISEIWNGYIYLVNLKTENESLKAKNELLQFENNKYQEMKLQYERLKDLLLFKESYIKKVIAAEVIGVDSTNWAKMLVINKGEYDGVKYNMVVVNYSGIIGRIILTSTNYSMVLLLTDPRSSVDAIVQKDRSRGVVMGTNRSILEVKYLPLDAKIEPGDILISSGMGGIFPKGLVIGAIISVGHDALGLFQNATLNPSANLSHLEEVLIITNN